VYGIIIVLYDYFKTLGVAGCLNHQETKDERYFYKYVRHIYIFNCNYSDAPAGIREKRSFIIQP